MMATKVADIIEAADAAYDEIAMALEMTPTVRAVDRARWSAVPHIRKFHDTVTPEHAALMEAVCEAEANGTDDELTAAGVVLAAYRKERGLE